MQSTVESVGILKNGNSDSAEVFIGGGGCSKRSSGKSFSRIEQWQEGVEMGSFQGAHYCFSTTFSWSSVDVVASS